MAYKWSNAQKTAFTVEVGPEHFVVVDETHSLWGEIPAEEIQAFEEPPSETATVPSTLSFAQFLIGLVSDGWITLVEARAWRDRISLPSDIVMIIGSLPIEQQFAAETRALAPSEIYRNDPLLLAVAQFKGKTEADLDAFFLKYGAI